MDVLRGRLSRGYVALSPLGITHHSWSFTIFVRWESVFGVETQEGSLLAVLVSANATPRVERHARGWRQPELVALPQLLIRGGYLSVDPALLLRVLEFYGTHPEARAELGRADAADLVRARAYELAT